MNNYCFNCIMVRGGSTTFSGRLFILNRLFIIVLFLFITIFFQKKQDNIALSDEKEAGGKLIITVKEGENWLSYFPLFLFIKKSKPPQMAFWLENTKGGFVATLYVTRKTAIQDWQDTAFFKKNERIVKPVSLPIWLHKHVRAGIHSIETCSLCHDKIKSADKSIEDEPLIDTFTGATPENGFTREWMIPLRLQPGVYIVCAEINHSFDYNDMYRKDLSVNDELYNGVSGQPSILFQGVLAIGESETSTVLKTVGHGNSAGKNGGVYGDLNGITSAVNIVRSIEVKYIPVNNH